MRRRILGFDPLTGLLEYHSYDPVTGQTIIESIQDVAPVLERNKALQSADDLGWSRRREMRRAAAIPDIIILKWRSEEGIDLFDRNHWPAVKRKLNSSEYRYLRTAPGRL